MSPSTTSVCEPRAVPPIPPHSWLASVPFEQFEKVSLIYLLWILDRIKDGAQYAVGAQRIMGEDVIVLHYLPDAVDRNGLAAFAGMDEVWIAFDMKEEI